jgi:hypothetical protein
VRSQSVNWQKWGIVTILLSLAALLLYMSSMCYWGEWGSEVLLELGCGLTVAVVIFLLLEQVVSEKLRKMDLFRTLIHDLHSNETAVRDSAIEMMTEKKWWKGADLHLSNLAGSVLSGINFQQADFRRANLLGANLVKSNLQKCNFRYADMRGAQLMQADLRCSDLRSADLRGAFLQEADLRDAKYNETDLAEANCVGAVFSPRSVSEERKSKN